MDAKARPGGLGRTAGGWYECVEDPFWPAGHLPHKGEKIRFTVLRNGGSTVPLASPSPLWGGVGEGS